MKKRRTNPTRQLNNLSGGMASLGGGIIALGTGVGMAQAIPGGSLTTAASIGASGLVGAVMMDKIGKQIRRR